MAGAGVDREGRAASSGSGGRGAGRLDGIRASCSGHQERITGRDVMFAAEGRVVSPGGPEWSLYGVCDGHGGMAAASHVKRHLWRELAPRLPTQRLPEFGETDYQKFARQVRRAVLHTFIKLDKSFMDNYSDDSSGAAVTVALLCDSLLTLANVGDADAVLDTGTDALLATVSHRVDSNEAERQRLLRAGALLVPLASSLDGPCHPGDSGFGPARCWPGGTRLSRSIGDVAAAEYVSPCPHVFQIKLPTDGARLLMGSTGLWDLTHWREAAHVSRHTPAMRAASSVVRMALLENNWLTHRDATAMVVDVLPANCSSFPRAVRSKLRRRRQRHWRARKWCCVDVRRGTLLHRLCWPEESGASDGLRLVANEDGLSLAEGEWEASAILCSSQRCSKASSARTSGRGSTSPGRRSAGYAYPARSFSGTKVLHGRSSQGGRKIGTVQGRGGQQVEMRRQVREGAGKREDARKGYTRSSCLVGGDGCGGRRREGTPVGASFDDHSVCRRERGGRICTAVCGEMAKRRRSGGADHAVQGKGRADGASLERRRSFGKERGGKAYSAGQGSETGRRRARGKTRSHRSADAPGSRW